MDGTFIGDLQNNKFQPSTDALQEPTSYKLKNSV